MAKSMWTVGVDTHDDGVNVLACGYAYNLAQEEVTRVKGDPAYVESVKLLDPWDSVLAYINLEEHLVLATDLVVTSSAATQ